MAKQSVNNNITVYGINNCDSVKKVRAALDENGVSYAFFDYKKQPLDVLLLQKFVAAFGLALINRKSATFRILNDAQKAALLQPNSSAFVALLMDKPMLIKRPIVWAAADGASTSTAADLPQACAIGVVDGLALARQLGYKGAT